MGKTRQGFQSKKVIDLWKAGDICPRLLAPVFHREVLNPREFLRIILDNIDGLFVKIEKCLAQPNDFQGLYAALRHLPKILFTSEGLAKSPASASCKAA